MVWGQGAGLFILFCFFKQANEVVRFGFRKITLAEERLGDDETGNRETAYALAVIQARNPS